MLSTGIKNSILILLIVLIFHFLIKNFLLNNNKHNFKKETFLDNDIPTCNIEKNVIQSNEKQINAIENIITKASEITCNFEEEGMSKNDIFASWFENETKQQTKDAELDKYFSGDIDMSKELEAAAKCPLPVRDTELPQTSTCDLKTDNIPVDVFKKNIKTSTPDQNSKRGMMLKEYENENIMNGGKLFMDLDPYNSCDNLFAEI